MISVNLNFLTSITPLVILNITCKCGRIFGLAGLRLAIPLMSHPIHGCLDPMLPYMCSKSRLLHLSQTFS